MVLEIVTFPSKRLRNKCEEVKQIDEYLMSFIEDMKDTLIDAKGYGLAAPQAGRSVRVILTDETAGKNGREGIKVFINPVLSEKIGEITTEEGCLSVPDEFAPVKRYLSVTVEAMDEKGQSFVMEAEGQMARILQHETDHLDGILFIDHLAQFRRDTMKKHIKRRIKEGEYLVVDK